MSSVKCFSCGEKIKIEFKPIKGDIIDCEECGTEFEITSTHPLKIDWVDEGDDYDDFDDDDDDDDDEGDY